jgi:pantothenate synthetase
MAASGAAKSLRTEKLDEAQAIFNELRSIKKAISTGEKERQDLIQVGSSHSCRLLPYL